MSASAETVSDPTAIPIDRPAEGDRSQAHPIVHAGKWILADMFSTLMYVGVYAVTHSISVATGFGIAVGVGQIVYFKLRRSPIGTMQWLSLGLVLVFGAASLFTHDPRFIMFKPTLIYGLVGVVMLKRGWMTRYVSAASLPWCRDVVTIFGYVWAGMLFLTGGLNLVMVAHGDPKLWAWYVGVFPIASKLALFAVQYVTMRSIVQIRMRAGALAPVA